MISHYTSLVAMALITLMVNTQPACSEDAEGESHSRFMPIQIQLGPHFGVIASKLNASPQYTALLKPTPSQSDIWMAPSFGVLVSARWRNGITLTLAPRREAYGVKTREQIVSLPENPFPHTLKSSTELSYTVWPLLLGMGWFTQRQHFQVQLGIYGAVLDKAKVDWTADGEPYGAKPNVEFPRTHSGWLLGTEYGYQVGNGELLFGIDSHRESESLMTGLYGTITVQAIRMHLAYAWSLKIGSR